MYKGCAFIMRVCVFTFTKFSTISTLGESSVDTLPLTKPVFYVVHCGGVKSYLALNIRSLNANIKETSFLWEWRCQLPHSRSQAAVAHGTLCQEGTSEFCFSAFWKPPQPCCLLITHTQRLKLETK